MSYGEWCPKCGAAIVSVTRGIPSMGTCSNKHVTDRRDTLRREPPNPMAMELATLHAELSAALARVAELEGLLKIDPWAIGFSAWSHRVRAALSPAGEAGQ